MGQTALVFLGTVVTIYGEHSESAVMRVDQLFKGSVPSQVELFDDGMCDGPTLKVGGQYLMYSPQTLSGGVPVRGCTRSRAVEDAGEDLQFLKTFVAGNPITQISGTVRYVPDHAEETLGEESYTPMNDVSINVSTADHLFQTKTDASGRYAISGLPPGKYELEAELAGYRTSWETGEIQLAAKGCAVADVLMKVDRRVQGTVRSADGHPVADALVEMIPTHPSSKREDDPILLGVSDDNGFYAVDGIPPGEYYLGINIVSTPVKERPYAPTYYPDTRDVKTAVPITLSTGASVLSYDLAAPPKLKMVRVRGSISDATGHPPRDYPQVRVKEPGLYGQIENDALTIDSKGLFEIELCEGVRYSAFAFSGSVENTTYSEPIEFIAGVEELHLVLNKSWKEFRLLSRRPKEE